MARDDRSTEVIVATVALLAITCVVVTLRCYVRIRVVKALGWDDGVMILAMAIYILYSASLFGAISAGYGKKIAMLTSEQRATVMKYLWGAQLTYSLGSSFCRFSVCIFLIRLTVKLAHIRIVQSVIVIAVIAMILATAAISTECIPLKYIWLRFLQDPTMPAGECNDNLLVKLMYVYSTLMALCDVILGILPIAIVRKLQMGRQTKIAIAGILGTAGCASAAVIVRTVSGQAYLDYEFFYSTTHFTVWSTVELSLGITAGSLATLGPLLRYFRCCPKNSDSASTPNPRPRVFCRPRGDQDRSYPLSTFCPTALRSDKMSTIVTEVQTRDMPGAQGTNHSRGYFAIQNSRTESRGTDGDMGLEIYRMYDVTQTSDAGSAIIQERV